VDTINSWRSKNKQWDKLAVKVRIGKLTIFDLYYDHAKRQFGIILFNLGVRTSPPQKKEEMGL
jgi:hypothetical protein